MKKVLVSIRIGLLALAFMAACSPSRFNARSETPLPPISTSQESVSAVTGTPTLQQTTVSCDLKPITIPTPLPVTPGYTELDSSTGLHVTGIATEIDLASYRLEIGGKVDHLLSLTYDELRCMPKIEVQTTIICKGNFEDTAVWGGASLAYILDLAGVQPGATQIRLTGADGYYALVDLKAALSEKSFLAYELRGQTIPILHGFPVRAAFPGLLGSNWVKWLLSINVE